MDTEIDLRLAGGVDAYLRNCPSRTVLDLLSDKWTLLLIGALSRGPRRFGELRRRLDGITQKMLSQTLRRLERDGLLTRTVHPTTPPSVEYALTELGRSTIRLLDGIRAWAETHVREVLAARASYDARTAPAPLRRTKPQSSVITTLPNGPRSRWAKASGARSKG
jgi:DNA-binding HxlR family transcriptional regulator